MAKKAKYELDLDEGILTIHFDPKSKRVSSSGKSVVLGTSAGFIWTEGVGISWNIIRTKKKFKGFGRKRDEDEEDED